MMKLTRRAALIALVVAGMTVSMLASFARAEVVVKDNGGVVTADFRFRVGPQPVCVPWPKFVIPFNGGVNTVSAACYEQWPPNAAAGTGRYDFGANKALAPIVWTYWNATLGGSSIETLPDSLIASVGLYIPGGGTALFNPPVDSVLNCRIIRSGTQVTLTIPTIVVGGVSVGNGGMQVRAANSNETSIAEYKLIVYPDSNAANADINQDGFGAAFVGSAVLEAGVGTHASHFSTHGGFTDADWILQSQPGSKFTLRPAAGVSKVVNVPNAATAVIVAIGHPRSVSRPVPSSTPIGLALLALALMGSGVWVMRSRQRTLAA